MKKLLNITYMIELQHYEIDVTYELDMKEDLNKNVLVIYSTIKDKDMVHVVADFIYRIFQKQRPSLGLVYFDAKHLYNRPLRPRLFGHFVKDFTKKEFNFLNFRPSTPQSPSPLLIFSVRPCAAISLSNLSLSIQLKRGQRLEVSASCFAPIAPLNLVILLFQSRLLGR